MNVLWVPAPPKGFDLMPVAPAPIRPKGKLGFDPARIKPVAKEVAK